MATSTICLPKSSKFGVSMCAVGFKGRNACRLEAELNPARILGSRLGESGVQKSVKHRCASRTRLKNQSHTFSKSTRFWQGHGSDSSVSSTSGGADGQWLANIPTSLLSYSFVVKKAAAPSHNSQPIIRDSSIAVVGHFIDPQTSITLTAAFRSHSQLLVY